MRIGNKSRLREEYKFAKYFLEECKSNPNLHPFALERGYQAITGSTTVDTEEIAYILSLKNPGQCLNDYLLGREYLNKLDIDSDFKLNFKKKYSDPWSRKWRKILFFIFYCVFAILALIPFVLPQYFPFRLLIITIPIYTPCAFICLDKFSRIFCAEKLVKNQQKYLLNIYLPSSSFYKLK